MSSINNTKYGEGALNSNTTGNNNNAFGAYALYLNTNGFNNVAEGANSLYYNTTGDNNTALGSGAVCNNTTGSNNTAVGSSALEGLVGQSVGEGNVAIGSQSLYNNEGNYNTAIGIYSGLNQGNGEYNTFLGANTDFDISSNNYQYSTAIGYGAKITSSNQIIMGGTGPSGYPNVVIPGNLFVNGSISGVTGIHGLSGTAWGQGINWNSITNSWQITGDTNLAFGNNAGRTGQSPYAVALSVQAGQNGQGQRAIAIGQDSGQNTQNYAAISIGYVSGQNSQGTQAIAIGEGAGQQKQSSQSIAIGYNTAQNTQGFGAIALGFQAGQYTQGSGAIAIGYHSGRTGQGLNAVAIGNYAGYSGQATNSIVLNATGTGVTGTNSGFYVAPIRNNSAYYQLNYNPSTKEIQYTSGIDILSGQGNGITWGNNVSKIYDDASGNLLITPLAKYTEYLPGTYDDNSLVPKQYVDQFATGINVKEAVYVATTPTTSFSGWSYDGSNNITGVGASLTIDGIVLDVSSNVLVKNWTGIANGTYKYDGSGNLIRLTDMDYGTVLDPPAFVFVQSGTLNALTSWVSSPVPATIGVTTDLSFNQFSSSAYKLGNGLTLSSYGGNNYLNVNNSLNFINSLDSIVGPTGSSGTLTIGTNTSNLRLGTTGGSYIQFANGITGSTGSFRSIGLPSGSTEYSINWGGGNSTIYDDGDLHIKTNTAMYFDNNNGNNNIFIGTQGNVGINTNSPQEQLTVNGNFEILNSGGIYFNGGNGFIDMSQCFFKCVDKINLPTGTSSKSGLDLYWDVSGNGVTTFLNYANQSNKSGGFNFYTTNSSNNPRFLASIDGSGNITANSYNATSDYRIKENIITLEDQFFSVDKLRPVSYINKNTENFSTGFIAHEVQEYFPFLVQGEKDGEKLQSLDYIGLIAILVKDIQQLQNRVKILEEKMDYK